MEEHKCAFVAETLQLSGYKITQPQAGPHTRTQTHAHNSRSGLKAPHTVGKKKRKEKSKHTASEGVINTFGIEAISHNGNDNNLGQGGKKKKSKNCFAKWVSIVKMESLDKVHMVNIYT